MTLYEITDDILRLCQMAEEEEIDSEVFADTLEGLEGEFEDKADSYAKVIRTLEGDIGSLKAEIDRLTARKRTIENNIKNMRQALKMAMRVSNKQEFKTALFSFGIQKNPPAVKIDDPEAIPAEYLIPQAPKVDNTAIKKMLKGLDDNEFCPWAHLDQTESLRIR